MIGSTLSRYTILEQIGSGGMGTVYRAQDTKLKRDVAIKVLPVGVLTDDVARHRFRKEALALSQLNHPNVATVHDFDTQEGVDFLVMEYIEGTTLNALIASGPLPERDLLQFGQQAAQGLAAAHERSIVHRDLKPANLRITPDRRLKILDFGLAELFHPGGDLGVTATATSASTTGPPGTLPYMAPEQLREEKLDHRTDLYAFGAVLFEMATGQRPFPETRGPRLIDAILHHQPTRPSALNRRVSPGLETVILKCLDKDPDRRYQSARELYVDLNRLATGAGIPRAHRMPRRAALAAVGVALLLLTALGLDLGGLRSRIFSTTAARVDSIAVLPLQNLSGDPNQEYFADGVTETLIGEFTRIRALRVISRWSVMQYKNSQKPLRDVAKELGVDAVVLGSVLRAGDHVRISVQLNHAASDTNLWAKNYEVPASDILSLQNDVVQNIVREVQVTLTPEERAHLARERTVQPEAHEAYLRGRFHWNRRTADGFQTALRYFEEAVQLDPGYAAAYAGMADNYTALASYHVLRPSEAMPKAKEAAQKALALDDSLAEAHASLGAARFFNLELAGVEEEFRRAIELNPGYEGAHHWYALFLSAIGRHSEALETIRRAQQSDPLSLIINANVGWCLYLANRHEEALDQVRRTLELSPQFSVAHEYRGQILLALGRSEEAVGELREAIRLSGGNPAYRAGLAYILALSGQRGQAEQILAQVTEEARAGYMPPYDIAIVHLGLGHREEAIRWFERAYIERNGRLVNIKVHPWLAALRSDPRIVELMRRIGFPD